MKQPPPYLQSLDELGTACMLDSINSLIIIFDKDDRIVHLNKACSYVTGFDHDELLQMRIEDRLLAPGEVHHGFRQHLDRDDTASLDIYTNLWNTSDGSTRIISWVNHGLRDADGVVRWVVATGTDITELQLGEEQILMNAEQQEILNNLLHIGMEDIPLQQKLQVCLQSTMAAGWIGRKAESAVFILDDDTDRVELFAQHGTQPANRNKMTSDSFNQVLCRPSIDSGHIQYTGLREAREHGCRKPWYSIPVKSGGKVDAVLILWLQADHEQDLGEIVFLHTVSNTIATIINRHKVDMNLQRTQQNLQAAQRIAEMGSWELNISRRVLLLSDEAVNILEFGTPDVPLELDAFFDLLHEDDVAMVSRKIDNAIRKGDHLEARVRTGCRGEPTRTLVIKGELQMDEHTGTRKLVGTVQDITSQMVARQEQKLISSVFEGAHESIIVLDSSNRIARVNRAFSDITGYGEAQIMGKYIDILNSDTHDETVYSEMWSSVEHNGSWCGELTSRKKNGELFSEWRTISTVRNSHGDIESYLVLSMDLSALKQSEERIHQLVYYDALTQLPNRSMFKSLLGEAVNEAECKHLKIAVLALGLDGLVRVNDSMGHGCGDRVLNIMADRLKRSIRTKDTVCRWGGDEFVILLADIKQMEYAMGVASKILNALVEPIPITDQESIVMGASVGISMYPVHGRDTISLIQNADVAMHRAKADGGNRYHVHSDEMNIDAVTRLSVESGLRNALEEDQFELLYQPLLQLSDNTIVSAEALIRWNHPSKGMILPDSFIPVAEDSGLIIPIGEWVIHEACRQCVAWQREGIPHIGVSINLSARQFYDSHLVQTVNDAVKRTGIAPSSITLEITESSIMDSANQTIEYLYKLKETGIQLSIDDFGTGYSSLAYIKQFPIDKLKIDRSFVRDVDINPDDRAIVQTIIAMGHNMNIDIVAEGVEKLEHMQYLKSQQCELVQGYYISKPIGFSSFVEFIKQHQSGTGDDDDSSIHHIRIM